MISYLFLTDNVIAKNINIINISEFCIFAQVAAAWVNIPTELCLG